MNIGIPTIESEMWGCRIEGHFFDTKHNDNPNSIDRIFPFVSQAQRSEYVQIISEKDRLNIGFGDIIAQPDAVFKFRYHPGPNRNKVPSNGDYEFWYDGLISLEYKSLSGYSAKKALHSPDKWKTQIRIKDVLQCIITAMQVSVKFENHTLPVLRYVNSAYVLYPSQELLQFIIDKAPKVKQYLEENRFVSSSQLAEHLSLEVEKLFKKESSRSEKAREKGNLNHDKMLG